MLTMQSASDYQTQNLEIPINRLIMAKQKFRTLNYETVDSG